MNPRERARCLVALAVGSPEPHEAAAAARQACRLIHEHGLLERLTIPSNPFAGVREDDFCPPPPQPTVPGSTARRQPDPSAVLIVIRSKVYCAGCGQELRRGTFATWSRGEVFHSVCYTNATEGGGSNGEGV